jgi:hypothetical protein
MKVIIAGNRNFTNYELLKKEVGFILQNIKEVEIVSGRCDRGVHTFTAPDGTKVYGADGLGERWAFEKGYDVKYFPADWVKYGLSAGPRRNREMAAYAQGLIAFFNGSRGTRDMIEAAKEKRLRIHIVKY